MNTTHDEQGFGTGIPLLDEATLLIQNWVDVVFRRKIEMIYAEKGA
jgi:hypothetical protein